MNDLYHHLTCFLRELRAQEGKPLLVISGPTASGKTGLSLRLAKHFDGEIISADSAQVYRGMDIGTAKVSPAERQTVPHHLIDIRRPDQPFTMADFKREANRAIEDILRRGKVPILCGGTGLYLSAVVDNYELPKAPPNPKIRAELQAEYEAKGKGHLYKMLLDLDPATAHKIHPNNVRYVARSLEIILQTQQPIQPRTARPLYSAFKIAVRWPRETLYERINQRVDQMLEEGLLNEIKSLLTQYPESCQAFSALGYKEFFPHLKGEATLQDCADKLKQATRNFAKRQLTWFRKEDDLYWIEPEEYGEIMEVEKAGS